MRILILLCLCSCINLVVPLTLCKNPSIRSRVFFLKIYFSCRLHCFCFLWGPQWVNSHSQLCRFGDHFIWSKLFIYPPKTALWGKAQWWRSPSYPSLLLFLYHQFSNEWSVFIASTLWLFHVYIICFRKLISECLFLFVLCPTVDSSLYLCWILSQF